MDSALLTRIQAILLEQRHNLTEWIHTTPAQKKRVRLGPAGEQAVHEHLRVLDTALEKAEDKTFGVCEICHGSIEVNRLEMDYTANVCVDDLSEEQKRGLERDLELSQQVQQALLPQQAPDIPGMELAAFSQPARIVSGDYFDFFRFQNSAHGLAIADVVDKGMAASLLMASLQASLRILVPGSDDPAKVVERLNALFCHNIRLIQFVTLFLGRFNHETRTLDYCNAGHNPPLLLRQPASRGEQVVWLEPTGAAIGLVEQFQFATATVTLSPGDILVLYTDGVTEAMNPQQEQFGTERLVEFVRHESSRPAQDLLRELRRLLQEFTHDQPPRDDTTVLVLKAQK